jgi:hypothetical protein
MLGQKAIGYSKFVTSFGDQYKELLIHGLPPVARNCYSLAPMHKYFTRSQPLPLSLF